MRFDIVTLFPELFERFSALGVVGRAVAAGSIRLRFRSPREFGVGAHRRVDDTPYGGGPGMVMRVDCLVACLESLDADAPRGPTGSPALGHRVLLTPQGRRLDQRAVGRLAEMPALSLVCGRYEGVDERLGAHVAEELSLGDFVLSGGEVAAMAIIEACSRLCAGVLGNPDSLEHESHAPAVDGLLEYPQYTRPAAFRGRGVPPVLVSGDHAAIAAWRTEQARARTDARRPDLIANREPPER